MSATVRNNTAYAPRYEEVMALANRLRRQADHTSAGDPHRRRLYLTSASIAVAGAVCAREKRWRHYEDLALYLAWQAIERAQGNVSNTENTFG